ncbi:FAD-dependent oxidoreductase [Streptacidiphilus sp. N1-12]|uniref:FAD-dependent oxidoreductase n=2 Tax=Streptacidiphilus alkalitolerans TaxID=3342712 RepID=A0ABV6WWH4_9ACTN
MTARDPADRYQVAVIGAGLAGAATAWELARRGISTALVEAYRPGHRQGSSHGSSQLYARSSADSLYVELSGQAEACWLELEADAGTRLRHRTGALDFGARRDPVRLAARLGAAGVPHELLAAEEAAERWPQLRFDPGPVLYHPDGGWLDPDATVAACVGRAVAHGAELRTGVRVARIEQLRSGEVALRGPGLDAAPVRAELVVVAAGAWLPELGLPVRLPPLTVTQQQVFHFRRREQPGPRPGWPVFVHRGEQQVLGLPSGADGGTDGVLGAFKLSLLDDGRVTTAGTRSGVVDPASRQAVSGYVRQRLPELDPEPFAAATSLRTSTPGGDFVLDRAGSLVIVSPCSGHGGKYAPLIGRLTADLVLGKAEAPARFALPASNSGATARLRP